MQMKTSQNMMTVLCCKSGV